MSLTPLSDRVDAPVDLQPAPVAGVRWRAATLDDLDTVVALLGRMSAIDHPEWSETREEMEEAFQVSWVDLARDTLLGESEDGTAVAIGMVTAPPEPESIVRVFLDGGVDPAHRGHGIGRSLLAWQVGRARQQLAASGLALPGWIMASSMERSADAASLLERAGFSVDRYFAELERDLSVQIPELQLPEPLRLATLAPELFEAARLAKNDAFRDHWGSQPTTAEGWGSMMALPIQRLDLSFVALDGEEVVGFVVTQVTESDWALQGFRGSYISLVGVTARWRRKGVAPALLAATLLASRDAGLERATLDVDSDSPTGAVGLYSGMGFRQVNGSRAHVLSF